MLVIPSAREAQMALTDKPKWATSASLYLIDGHRGFWLRIPRKGRQGITTPVEKAVVAQYDTSLAEFVPCDTANVVLQVLLAFEDPGPKEVIQAPTKTDTIPIEGEWPRYERDKVVSTVG